MSKYYGEVYKEVQRIVIEDTGDSKAILIECISCKKKLRFDAEYKFILESICCSYRYKLEPVKVELSISKKIDLNAGEI